MRLIFLFPLLVLVSSLFAQQNLSLAEAIARCLQNNYDIQIGKEQLSISERNNTILAAGFFPQLSIGANQTNRVNEQIRNVNPFALAGQSTNIGVQPFARLNWRLFGGFSAHISLDRLQLLEESSAGNVHLIIENSTQAVMLNYYEVIVQQELLNLRNEALKNSRKKFVRATYQFNLGTSTSFQKLQFETAYLTDSIAALNQYLQLEQSKRNLNLLMAEPIQARFILTDALANIEQFPNYQQLLDQLFSSNQQIKNQFIQTELSGKNIGLQKATQFPTFDVNAGWNYDYTFFKAEAIAEDFRQGRSTAYFVNFSLNFNLFNGGNIRRAIKDAESNYQIALLNEDKLKLQLEKQLADEYENYQTRIAVYNLSLSNAQSSARQLTQAEEKLKLGLISSFDYREIQENWLQSNFNQLQNLFLLKQAEINIARLIGDFRG